MSVVRHLFIGDSVTDCGRREDPEHLGFGYVRLIAEELQRAVAEEDKPSVVVNTGIGGDRVQDLRRRWAADCLAHEPDVVTVLVGVNDTWRRYDSGDVTTVEAFATDYRSVLDTTRAARPATQIVLMEPFVIPVTAEQSAWREDLDPKIAVVHDLAAEYGAVLVPLDELFTARAQGVRAQGVRVPTISRGMLRRGSAERVSPQTLADDGVHPTEVGHQLIARAWLTARNIGADAAS